VWCGAYEGACFVLCVNAGAAALSRLRCLRRVCAGLFINNEEISHQS